MQLFIEYPGRSHCRRHIIIQTSGKKEPHLLSSVPHEDHAGVGEGDPWSKLTRSLTQSARNDLINKLWELWLMLPSACDLIYLSPLSIAEFNNNKKIFIYTVSTHIESLQIEHFHSEHTHTSLSSNNWHIATGRSRFSTGLLLISSLNINSSLCSDLLLDYEANMPTEIYRTRSSFQEQLSVVQTRNHLHRNKQVGVRKAF